MVSLSFLFGRGNSRRLFERSRNCLLTTITGSGTPKARKLRVVACSEDGDHVWFVISKESGIVADVKQEPRVILSAIDPDSHQLVHASGMAGVFGYEHQPLYLAPGFEPGQALSVVSDDADIALLRVDVHDSRLGTDDEPVHRVFRVLRAGAAGADGLGHAGDT